ncbi:MAG: DNA-protecting protein DprA [Oscillospiraceae bacterium]|nr:DNA-protecting protein DprA [Oscillospiraceae bacterium]
MTPREQGFLLLTSYLGDPKRRPLTIAQFRKLAGLARTMEKPSQERELTVEDLQILGCDVVFARRVVHLLSQEEQLNWYVKRGKENGCVPITRLSVQYPGRLRKVLGLDAPGTLWLKGDLDILQTPTISVVGSRELKPENTAFAEEIGRQAAVQGYTLVSGNARGADRTAQDSCLKYGGKVISVVADELASHPARENVLYMSEEGFDLAFTTARALQRNRIIHSFSDKTFVVQATLGKGGTWSGACNNLRHNWSQVICFDDGSDASRELNCMGALPIKRDVLSDFAAIQPRIISF